MAQVGGGEHGDPRRRGPPGLQHRRARHDRHAGRGGRHASRPDALILGAGATACAALAALRGIGTRQAAVAVRDPATAGPLLAVAERLGLTARLVPFGAGPRRARGGDAADLDRPGRRGRHLRRTDRVARPRAPRRRGRGVSPVADPAGRRGRGRPALAVAGGFELLLHQATGQVELMTGRDAPVEAMRGGGPGRAGRASRSSGISGANITAAAREYRGAPQCVMVCLTTMLSVVAHGTLPGHASGGPPRPPPT